MRPAPAARGGGASRVAACRPGEYRSAGRVSSSHLPVGRVGTLPVDVDVTVAVAGLRPPDAHGLVPAVRPRDRVRVDREREVLVHAHVGPPDAQRVRVEPTRRAPTPCRAPQRPRSSPRGRGRRWPSRCAGRRSPSGFQRPMWWLHATTPGRIPSVTQAFTHEVADLRLDANEVPGRADAQARRVGRVDPQRVRVRDLVQPLGVSGSACGSGRAAGRSRSGTIWSAVHALAMDVAPHVSRHRQLRPAPVVQRARPELQAPGRRREAAQDLAVDAHPHTAAAPPRRAPTGGSGTHVRGPGASARGVDATGVVDLHVRRAPPRGTVCS